MIDKQRLALTTALWLVHTLAGPLVFVALAYWSWTLAGRILRLVRRAQR